MSTLTDEERHEDAERNRLERGRAADRGSCAAPGCDRPAWARGYCPGHLKELRTKGTATGELRPYGREPSEAFWDAVFDLLDLRTSDGEAWRAAKKRVEVYARRWVGRKGKTG